jgi:hypothetical protein
MFSETLDTARDVVETELLRIVGAPDLTTGDALNRPPR